MSISCARLIEPFRSGLADPCIESRICWKLNIDFNGRTKILSRHCDFQRSVMSQSVLVCMVKRTGFHPCQFHDRKACIPGPKGIGQNRINPVHQNETFALLMMTVPPTVLYFIA